MQVAHSVGVDGLQEEVERILAAGAAWSTQARWTSSQRKFLWFCSLSGVKKAVPTTASLLMLHCAWLVRGGLAHGTILLHIDGVRVLNANFGHACTDSVVALVRVRSHFVLTVY